MEKRIYLLMFSILLIFSISLSAQEKQYGFGVMVGEPTGLSAKYWLNNDNALDFGFAYSFIGSNNGFSLHCDYVYHLNDVIKSNLRLPLYYGFGARIRAANNAKGNLGARGVFGLLYIPEKIPIDTFIEIAPVFNILPETSLGLDIALGARYYFE